MSTLHMFHELIQNTPEWYEARRGVVTASIVKHLVAIGAPDATAVNCPTCGTVAKTPCIAVGRKVRTEIKTIHDERAAAAKDLPPTYVPTVSEPIVYALAAERISKHVEETWTSRDMERGILAEPHARDLYSRHYAPAAQCGFMKREFDGFEIGYSPDGLVGDDGLIEIKAPRQKSHVAAVVKGEVPGDHMAQFQTGLLVAGRAWIDYVPYYGGLPLWRKRVTPDPAWQEAIISAAEQTEKAIADVVAKYETAVKGLPVTKRIDLIPQEIF